MLREFQEREPRQHRRHRYEPLRCSARRLGGCTGTHLNRRGALIDRDYDLRLVDDILPTKVPWTSQADGRDGSANSGHMIIAELLTGAVVIPYDGTLGVLLDSLVVTRKLGVDCGTEAWKLGLVAHVVGDALREHVREKVHCCLQVAVAFYHDAEDEILEVAVCLLLLWKLSEQ